MTDELNLIIDNMELYKPKRDYSGFRQYLMLYTVDHKGKPCLNSKATVEMQISRIDLFFKKYSEFTQDNVNDFIIELVSKRKKTYVNKILTSLRKWVAYNNIEDIQIPASFDEEKAMPKDVITEDMLHYILKYVDQTFPGEYRAMQVKATLVFLFYTGLRRTEMLKLSRDKFHFSDNKLEVYPVFISKQQMEKKLRVPAKAIHYIRQYFDVTPEKDNAFNLTKTSIPNIFIRLNEELALDFKLNPHMMRAAAINHLYRCGWTVEEIALIIGITPETIRDHYLRITQRDIDVKWDKIM